MKKYSYWENYVLSYSVLIFTQLVFAAGLRVVGKEFVIPDGILSYLTLPVFLLALFTVAIDSKKFKQLLVSKDVKSVILNVFTIALLMILLNIFPLQLQ